MPGGGEASASRRLRTKLGMTQVKSPLDN